MALSIGAATRDMEGGFYGHVLSRDVFSNNMLWPFPILDFLASAGIILDGEGNRFCDEARGGVYVANALARLSGSNSAYVIFDATMWDTAGAYRAIPPNPHLILAGGSVTSAPTLRRLAELTGLPLASLEATVDEYNTAVQNNRLNDIQPPRTTPIDNALALQRAPFYAIPAVAGITYTMGGLSIDSNARVLSTNGAPIPGLFAAGANTGGLDGGPRSGYVGGLMKSAVFGLIAGENA